VAWIYPTLERVAFGRKLEDARNAFFDSVVCRKRLLLIGEGNGRFLAKCVRHKIGGSITVVDLSGKMLSLVRSRVKRIEVQTALELVHSDFREWQGVGQQFDAVVTHFFLDLFLPDSQRTVIEKITALSRPKTIWVNIDFRPTLASPLNRCVDWLQYRFDRLISGVEADHHYDPAPLIRAAGWLSRQERTYCDGAVIAELFEPSV
jgi:ubiquinone/menaquinone biosynthesis C-methylase UbiE